MLRTLETGATLDESGSSRTQAALNTNPWDKYIIG